MEKKIIVGDFSGIQNYIYNIQRNKSATKRLKGRSFFIELLLEKIKNDLIKILGNYEEYLTSGGKFIIITNDFKEDKFNKFKKEIENKLYNQFYGELKIIFGISDYKEGKFKDSLNNAFEELTKKKNRAFEEILIKNEKWDSDKFIFSKDRGPDNVCKFSRGNLIINKINDVHINNIIEEEKVKGMGLNTVNDIIISNYIAGIDGGNTYINIFDNETIELKDKYKIYLPKKDGNIKTFEDLAGKSNKLACLKGDIDDLGKLFMFGLEKNNYKQNYKDLSELLEEFWNNELYKTAKGKDIYIVYAGGDDFLVLGNWIEVIKFYNDLLKNFQDYILKNEIQNLLIEEYKLENKIHFSGAINLFLEHDTFFTVVTNTGELLDKAKKGDKNQVNIFGKVINNEDYCNLFQEIEKFQEKYSIKDNSVSEKDNNIISVSTLRFLLGIAKKIILEEEISASLKDKKGNIHDFFEYGTWRSELFYHLARNYKTRNNNDIKDEFRNYIDGMILHNNYETFTSLAGNNNLFNEKYGEKLFIMITYLLYKMRNK